MTNRIKPPTSFADFWCEVERRDALAKEMGGEPWPRELLEEMKACCAARGVKVVWIDTGHPTHVIGRLVK